MRAAVDIALFIGTLYNYFFGKRPAEQFEPDYANPDLEDIDTSNPVKLGYQ